MLKSILPDLVGRDVRVVLEEGRPAKAAAKDADDRHDKARADLHELGLADALLVHERGDLVVPEPDLVVGNRKAEHMVDERLALRVALGRTQDLSGKLTSGRVGLAIRKSARRGSAVGVGGWGSYLREHLLDQEPVRRRLKGRVERQQRARPLESVPGHVQLLHGVHYGNRPRQQRRWWGLGQAGRRAPMHAQRKPQALPSTTSTRHGPFWT